MTIVGKILVFINLLFSIVLGALVLVVYMTRLNYSTVYKQEQNYHKVDVAALQASKLDNTEIIKNRDADLARLKAEYDRVFKHLEDQQKVNQSILDSLNEEKKKSERSEVLLKQAEVEVARRQKDVEQMRDTLKSEMAKVVALVQEKNSLLERTTAAEIQTRTVLEINRRMEYQLQEMARDMARMKASGTAATVTKTGKNPPPEAVEGLIKETDPSGLVKLTIGSDSGLLRGHTMEVFRINRNNPAQSKYLGTLRIIEVSPQEAVGQPMGRMQDAIKRGDNVASRILGG